MKYTLRPEASHDKTAASAELSDGFAAERWAKSWVNENARSDAYTLESDDGRFAMRVFRTKAGQWYLTPRVTAA